MVDEDKLKGSELLARSVPDDADVDFLDKSIQIEKVKRSTDWFSAPPSR